jgi:CubicO group peptidase (beta-lactamase class C family)
MHLASILVTAIVYCAAGVAQPIVRATPESVGMSSDRLSLIGEALGNEIANDRTPGAVVAIARRGKLVYYEAFGFLDKERGIPMPRDAIFSIWSMTKPVAAVGALQLFERGKLRVNEPIDAYLPELANRQVAIDGDVSRTEPARRQPTVRDLMRHTAGFNYPQRNTPLDRVYPSVGPGPGNAEWSDGRLVDALSKLPLHHQPGTTWAYGQGLDLVGVIVERISGQTFGEYLHDNIFEPLGMVDTAFTIPAGKRSRQAQVLPLDPISGEPQQTTDHTQMKFECGGGCLASTAMDYLVFAQALLNGGTFGNTRILGPKTVEFMTSDHTVSGIDLTALHTMPVEHTDGYGFGLGVAVRRGAGTGGTMGSVGGFQWSGAHGTAFWVDPQEELVIVYMAQTPGAIRRYYRQFMPALVYQAISD